MKLNEVSNKCIEQYIEELQHTLSCYQTKSNKSCNLCYNFSCSSRDSKSPCPWYIFTGKSCFKFMTNQNKSINVGDWDRLKTCKYNNSNERDYLQPIRDARIKQLKRWIAKVKTEARNRGIIV